MAGLFDKLNVLLRANVNDFLSNLTGDRRDSDSDNMPDLATMVRDGKVPAANLGRDIDEQIGALRKKIDSALDHQDGLQNQLDGLDRNVAALSQRADTALQRGDESGARQAQSTIQSLEAQADVLRSELDDHRQMTSEFIERVNVLEAAVSDARHNQGVGVNQGSVQPPLQMPAVQTPVQSKPAVEPPKPTTIKINVRTEATGGSGVQSTSSTSNPPEAATPTQTAATTPAATPSTTAPSANNPSLSDVLRNAQSRFDSYLDEQLAHMESRRKAAEEAGERAMAQIAELDAKNIDKAEFSMDTVASRIHKDAGYDPMADANTPVVQNNAPQANPSQANPVQTNPTQVSPTPTEQKPPSAPKKPDESDDLDTRRARLTKPD